MEYRLKLTGQILKAAVIYWGCDKSKVDTDETQFGFMPGCRNTNTILILRELYERYLEAWEVFFICRFGKSLWLCAQQCCTMGFEKAKGRKVIDCWFIVSVLSYLVFIIALEAICEEIRLECLQKLFYAAYLGLVKKKTLESWKIRTEVLKEGN